MELSGGLQFVIGLGVLIAGAGYAWGQFKKGSMDGKKSTIDLLGEEVEKLRSILDQREKDWKQEKEQHAELVHQLQKEIAILKTQIEEKDRKLLEYIQIFQGRNPQLENALTNLTAGLKEIHSFMQRNANHAR